MTTLKDVAQMAGVSVSTVSYVLNGKKKVRPETLKRIENAIDALDYCPNLMASGLKTNLSRTVGIVVSDMENIFNVELLKSIEAELDKSGYCMTVCNSDNDAEREKKCLRRLLSRNIDGLLLIGTGISDLTNYRNIKLPLVCMDRVSDEKFFTVCVDHVYGGKIATEYLLGRGYQNILFVGCSRYLFSKDRYRGYEQAMTEAGKRSRIKNLEVPDLDPDTACNEIERLIRKGMKFDAVFGCLDYIAMGAMKALLRNGISIPDQVGVIGYDDIAPARYLYPELTSVAQPKQQIGKLSVRSLMDMIRGEKRKDSAIFLKPELVKRGSC